MARRDDDDFAPRPGAPRRPRRHAPERFVARVLRAAGVPRFGAKPRKSASHGRGQAAARVTAPALGNGRRAVVKVRLVRASASSPGASAAHLRYIERDGVGPRGEPGQAYGPTTDRADLADFQKRCADDRHHFRVILAPEDSARLGDLRAFTRQWIRSVEADLGTRTEWVAVDHWNTDNPHTHIVLRGVDDRGRDLVIAPDYIAHGLRTRASELATLWLGPRTEREIESTLRREVAQERWTRLDQSIQRAQDGDEIRLVPGAERSALLRARLQTLTTLGLAESNGNDVWRLRGDWQTTLRRMGERGDIIRTLQRAMGSTREFTVFDGTQTPRAVIGRIADKGLIDELSDRGWLAVDGLDGRAHYVALPNDQALDDYPRGAIVEVRAGGVRAVDTAIAQEARDGLYRAAHDPDTERLRTRRLEALRSAGIVERIGEGVWKLPADLPERGRAFDARELGGATVALRSHLAVEQQSRAIGATWLDQQLTGRPAALPPNGFGAQVRDALVEREQFLIEQGLARRSGQRLLLARDLLETLRARELVAVAERLQAQTGLPHRPLVNGQSVHGVYRRSLQLVSGRYALLDDGSGFSLVPWRAVIDKHLGQSIAATLSGGRVSWEFGRQRGLSR